MKVQVRAEIKVPQKVEDLVAELRLLPQDAQLSSFAFHHESISVFWEEER